MRTSTVQNSTSKPKPTPRPTDATYNKTLVTKVMRFNQGENKIIKNLPKFSTDFLRKSYLVIGVQDNGAMSPLC